MTTTPLTPAQNLAILNRLIKDLDTLMLPGQEDLQQAALHTIVQMYDNENQSALTVGALMQDQGQDIVQWVQLIDYANRQLVAALETAHEQITQLAGAEHARMEHQNRLARAW